MGEIGNRDDIISEVFKNHDVLYCGELKAEQIQDIHADLRLGGISLPQVNDLVYQYLMIVL